MSNKRDRGGKNAQAAQRNAEAAEFRDRLAVVAGTVPQLPSTLAQIKHALEEVVEDNVALTRSMKGISDSQDTLRAALVRELDLLRNEVASELQVQAVRQCCQELTPVLSALERLAGEGDLSDVDTTRQHLDSLATTMRAALGRIGLEPLPVVAGTDVFDSRVHDCVRTCTAADSPIPAAARGIVVHVQEPGYTVRGRTVRPARVWVQGSETEQQPAKDAQP